MNAYLVRDHFCSLILALEENSHDLWQGIKKNDTLVYRQKTMLCFIRKAGKLRVPYYGLMPNVLPLCTGVELNLRDNS